MTITTDPTDQLVNVPLPDFTDGFGDQDQDQGATAPDPEAPYGRKADGTPRRSNGGRRPKAERDQQPAPRPRAPRAQTSGGSRGSSRTASSARSAPDYRPGVAGLLQIPSAMLAMVGRATGSPALIADGIVIQANAPVIADALHQLATQEPAVASALDWILRSGPYGAILGALLPVALQLATNHGVIPPSDVMGTASPDVIIAAFAPASNPPAEAA